MAGKNSQSTAGTSRGPNCNARCRRNRKGHDGARTAPNPGQHALAISNSKHLTGNFNAHLRDCVFLFADEAFFAGDRQHMGVLKSIITEPYLTIEGKYQNAAQTPNFLHLMMASNEERVVPASIDARRFFVLEVGDKARNNHDYFAAIWQAMETGGYQAMLYEL